MVSGHITFPLVAGLLVLLVLAACGQPTAAPATDPQAPVDVASLEKNSDGYADISVHQLRSLLEAKDFTFVNVHIPYEGEIEQTDLFIPYNQIGSHLGELPDKDAPIVLYCRTGSMSTSAAKELAALGYTNVVEVDGGFVAWESAGYEILHK